jgi:predicted nucleic acid-binding protein
MDRATEIIKSLRKANRMIGLPIILIAATALGNNMRLSTLNVKDFERIEDLTLLS